MFSFKRKRGVQPAVLIGLTAMGRAQAEQWDSGGNAVQALTILSEYGPMTLSNLRRHLEQRQIMMSFGGCRQFVRGLQKRGLVQPIGPDGQFNGPS